MKLQGNTILLTGGSAGIGLALAREFLALGNKVIITGRNAAKLEAAREATPELVPIQLSPIYCATKAALHSYTVALRQQLKDQGVEVIELMPPAVHTDLTADLPDDGDFKIISTEQLMTETFKGLRAGREEIRPGQANQLYWMSRIAPAFINGQLEKGSKALVPPPERA